MEKPFMALLKEFSTRETPQLIICLLLRQTRGLAMSLRLIQIMTTIEYLG